MISRMVLLLSIVTLIGLTFFAAACQTPAGETTQVVEVNPLVGDWVQTLAGDPNYLRFTADGKFSIAHLYNDLEKFPVISGTFFYEDSKLTLNTDPKSQKMTQRCSGETASYSAIIDQAGQLIVGDVEAECPQLYFLSSEEAPWVPYSP